VSALVGGYHLAFLLGAIFSVAGAAIGTFLLHEQKLPEAELAVEPLPASEY